MAKKMKEAMKSLEKVGQLLQRKDNYKHILEIMEQITIVFKTAKAEEYPDYEKKIDFYLIETKTNDSLENPLFYKKSTTKDHIKQAISEYEKTTNFVLKEYLKYVLISIVEELRETYEKINEQRDLFIEVTKKRQKNNYEFHRSWQTDNPFFKIEKGCISEYQMNGDMIHYNIIPKSVNTTYKIQYFEKIGSYRLRKCGTEDAYDRNEIHAITDIIIIKKGYIKDFYVEPIKIRENSKDKIQKVMVFYNVSGYEYDNCYEIIYDSNEYMLEMKY